MNKKQTEAINSLLGHHQEITGMRNLLDAEIQDIKEQIMKTMESEGLETLLVGEDDNQHKVTIVRPSVLKLDEEGLETALSKAQWKLVTKQTIDKKALENAVVRGKIDPLIVSENSKEVPSKPYLRITG